MIQVGPNHSIDENEIHLVYIQSSGPGGQNINKVATAVQLRFNIRDSKAFTEAERERIMQKFNSRLTKDGEFLIHANRYRTQEGNKQDAIDRLENILREGLKQPRKRKRTKPSKAAVQRRLDAKRKQSFKKSQRKIKYE